jgi:hypothetical protein
MTIDCIWEHNGRDSLLYAADFVGAFTRGENLEAAVAKMPREIATYCRWKGDPIPATMDIRIIRDCPSTLAIRDADSDAIFPSETQCLTTEEYHALKNLALRSAQDFLTLFQAIPDPQAAIKPPRDTFYGPVPRTAQAMYDHTKSVNTYYFAEIGVDTDNDGTIVQCRTRGFALLESQPDFLSRGVLAGSYGECWSLRKVLRRFIWHDRIHAKAMYRLAKATYPKAQIPDLFFFDDL